MRSSNGVALLLWVSACGGDAAPRIFRQLGPECALRSHAPFVATASARRSSDEAVSVNVLTYNIAGLPERISKSRPVENIPQTSVLINHHDLVLAQEDFAYHNLTLCHDRHPFQSEPWRRNAAAFDYGDGLNQFSIFQFDAEVYREAWTQCYGVYDHGTDCLASKGFSYSVVTLADDMRVGVYNLHMDAGRYEPDISVRTEQVAQLLAHIATRDANLPLVVAGDTNIRPSLERNLELLLQGAQLKDACRELACGDDDRIDRVMYRSAGGVSVTPSNWRIDERFVDAAGVDLSDHKAVAVTLTFQKARALPMVASTSGERRATAVNAMQ